METEGGLGAAARGQEVRWLLVGMGFVGRDENVLELTGVRVAHCKYTKKIPWICTL